MFELASTLLSNYITIDNRPLWRFDIYAIEAERGENPEDVYYLCNVRESWFVVLETDYINSLHSAAQEAARIFNSDEMNITHWIAKRGDDTNQQSIVPLEAAKDKEQWPRLIYSHEDNYLRYAVLSVDTKIPPQHHFDPSSYGYTSQQN